MCVCVCISFVCIKFLHFLPVKAIFLQVTAMSASIAISWFKMQGLFCPWLSILNCHAACHPAVCCYLCSALFIQNTYIS